MQAEKKNSQSLEAQEKLHEIIVNSNISQKTKRVKGRRSVKRKCAPMKANYTHEIKKLAKPMKRK